MLRMMVYMGVFAVLAKSLLCGLRENTVAHFATA
jgi:hypothetical protein